MIQSVMVSALAGLICWSGDDVVLAQDGKTPYVIVVQPGATLAETHAAKELAYYLERLSGASFPIQMVDAGAACPNHAIIVGPGPVATTCFPVVDLTTFGSEEVIVELRPPKLLIAGGRPRGTLYAVYRFLHEHCGCRWWAPWAESIARNPVLRVAPSSLREKPCFDYRDVNCFPAQEAAWSSRNLVNGASFAATEAIGENVQYAGFVHTFFSLVPPDPNFRLHPEWFSLIDGQRTTHKTQLCLTNPALQRFTVEQVKAVLRNNRKAQIVSVSQNDNHGHCDCPACGALDKKHGSRAGSLLHFVNRVAVEVAKDFPDVLVDTLAYSKTRKVPAGLRAAPNVVVRLCSIECDVGVPFDHLRNSDYAADLRSWSNNCDHLYTWDYTANFNHYCLPHPDWFVLGPNLRFLQQHGVKGVFCEGAYAANGGEMAELRSWLQARLLWNPRQNEVDLLNEFLVGYYGPNAAKYIAEYFKLMSDAQKGTRLSCFNEPSQSPCFTFKVLNEAEHLWQAALRACQNEPDYSWRVGQGHLSVRYAWLVRWAALRRECRTLGQKWPVPDARGDVAKEWLRTATKKGPPGWSPLTNIDELHLITPEEIAARLSREPQGVVDSTGPVPGWLGSLFWAILGAPRGLFWLAGLPLAIGIGLAWQWPRPGWRKTRLAFGGMGSLALGAAVVLYLWNAEQLTARPAAYVILGISFSLAFSLLQLLLQLHAFTRRIAWICFFAALTLAGTTLVAHRPYFEARIQPLGARDFRNASFCGANLHHAILHGANLEKSDLSQANLSKAYLIYARMQGARLCGADLHGAILIYTDLRDADLRGADLRGAQIQDVTSTMFTGASYDSHTRWPEGFRPEDWDMIQVD
jgi:hypothetical protein